MANTKDTTFARDKAFWTNYLEGRPRAPASFFDRIFRYHEENGGKFDTVHDAGAGNGPYAQQLRSRFQNVIISDVVPTNVKLAEDRLGTDGFKYRVARVEEASDIESGSVDMVFATNVMHFANQQAAMQAVATQLRTGGTMAVAGFGPARFRDQHVQDVWQRMTHQGGRLALKRADNPADTINVMQRTSGSYNVAPLDDQLFKSGAMRLHLNMDQGGLTQLYPPEEHHKISEPNHTGANDRDIFETEEGWSVDMDLEGLRTHFNSFPFSSLDPSAYTDLWQEMEGLLKDGKVVNAYFPAKIILATRR